MKYLAALLILVGLAMPLTADICVMGNGNPGAFVYCITITNGKTVSVEMPYQTTRRKVLPATLPTPSWSDGWFLNPNGTRYAYGYLGDLYYANLWAKTLTPAP